MPRDDLQILPSLFYCGHLNHHLLWRTDCFGYNNYIASQVGYLHKSDKFDLRIIDSW